MTLTFFPATGHHDIPDDLHRLWHATPGIDLEHHAFEPTSAFISEADGVAFVFGPELDEDGEVEGWSWTEHEWVEGEERWLPMTGGDGSIGADDTPLVDAATEWVLTHAPSPLTPDALLDTRTALGLKQGDLADLLRVNQSTVHRWERGERAIPATVGEDLDLIVDDFLADVESGTAARGPWERAVRFWHARRDRL